MIGAHNKYIAILIFCHLQYKITILKNIFLSKITFNLTTQHRKLSQLGARCYPTPGAICELLSAIYFLNNTANIIIIFRQN